MAWTDQCKFAFKTNVESRLLKTRTRKGIMKILKELATESEIPQKTLYRWWNGFKSLKTETNGQGSESTGEEAIENVAIVAFRPICSRCNVGPVKLTMYGKPYSPKSKYFGLCSACAMRQVAIGALDRLATKEDGIEAICPECHKHFYINQERVKEVANA